MFKKGVTMDSNTQNSHSIQTLKRKLKLKLQFRNKEDYKNFKLKQGNA